MHHPDIDAMNSDLYHRIHPPAPGLFSSSEPIPGRSPPLPPPPVFLPYIFNAMLDPSQTEDGLHYSDIIVKAQANLLFNFHCNDLLPKKFPLDKTCCRSYPIPSFTHALILVVVCLWGPVTWLLSRRGMPCHSMRPSPFILSTISTRSIICAIYSRRRDTRFGDKYRSYTDLRSRPHRSMVKRAEAIQPLDIRISFACRSHHRLDHGKTR
jgi:hypothetical protein